ncbi:hypothetical protein IE4872_PD02271 (plasmid) [Rhizobium gallicum]|uniref:Uncharacterized protein n=1 Tax=Rhizobium gallicum TaxID=56730 RepID=A0A1L5NXX9_9HYPH|nr:hypothetical protein IE4872_PD02271 [Rhizobium gallicum]
MTRGRNPRFSSRAALPSAWMSQISLSFSASARVSFVPNLGELAHHHRDPLKLQRRLAGHSASVNFKT